MPNVWVVSRAGRIGDPSQSVWLTKNLAVSELERLVEKDLEAYRGLGNKTRERLALGLRSVRRSIQKLDSDGDWRDARVYYAAEFEVSGSAVDALGAVRDA